MNARASVALCPDANLFPGAMVINARLPGPRHIERQIEDEACRLRAASRWVRWLVLDAGAVAIVAVLAILDRSVALGLALGAGAAALLVIASIVRSHRHELIGRLALDGSAYVIPEVAAYGERCARAAELSSLSEWLREAVARCGEESSWLAHDRVRAYRDELIALAAELRAPNVLIAPSSAVECRRLLTRTVESPLYNDHLPPENVRAAIYRIRAGIRPR